MGMTPDNAPMEQVRDLLFGSQLKDMETRFQRREERFLREIEDARESMKKRLDSLELFMKSETSTLLARLKEEKSASDAALKGEQRERAEAVQAEQRERAEAFAKLSKDISQLTDAMDRKVARLTDSIDAMERELRNLLLAESGGLGDKIEEKYREALNVLSSTASQIRQDMVYRSNLSTMLTEIAVKLSGQWTLELDPGHSGGMEEAADDADN